MVAGSRSGLVWGSTLKVILGWDARSASDEYLYEEEDGYAGWDILYNGEHYCSARPDKHEVAKECGVALFSRAPPAECWGSYEAHTEES